MSHDPKRIQAIFLAAVGQPPESRSAYLDRECGDEVSLRQRVEALLLAHDLPGSFLESPAAHPAAPLLPPTDAYAGAETLGTAIGPYKLREVLGEGGMGIVYAAEQEQPIRRKVALKVIKPGMDSKEVIARLQVERQALALMDHPNIAKVIDAGTTDSGRPYFVMELVRGMPITDYCDQRRLPMRDRLKLFITVCQAVQHAHSKGIIHRDLKPSNVMITLHDGAPVPKIIDFGVAKALNQRLTEHTLYTRNAQLIGTPMYMSPEQAELSGLEIDTRSDVYSLGVLLYELLTGQTPFDKETFSKLGYDELRRMIREDEPPRPSQRVSTLAAEKLSTIAERRDCDDRQLTRSLKGELDWIVMKALEKDRTRRYGLADGLASDVQAYLDDKPVQACPPSYVYRTQKFVRRKRGVLTTMALLAVCLPLAALGVYSLIQQTGPPTVVEKIVPPPNPPPTPVGQTTPAGVAPKPSLNARAPGRYLPGLIPEPPLIPDVGRWQMIPKKPRGRLYSAVWSPDERWIALGETVNVRIYDSSSMQLVRVLVGHSAPVFSVAWHPSGERLASAGEDGAIRLWTSDGAPTHVLEGHLGPVYQVTWSPDGERLASASADGSVRTWNADGSPQLVLGTPHEVVGTQDYHVFCVDWSPDGKLLASGGGDMCPPPEDGPYGDTTVKIWDAETGSLVRTCDGSMKHSVLCVDWRPDGQQVAAGYGEVFRNVQGGGLPVRDAGIRVWNADGSPAPGPQNIDKDGSINSIAWHPQGDRLAYGAYSVGNARIWNSSNGSVVNVSDKAASAGFGYSVAWNSNGSGLLSTHREALTEWHLDGTSTDLTGNLREVGPNVIRWSSDGTLIFATSRERAERLFWTSDGASVSPPTAPAGDAPAWWELDRPDRRPDGTKAPALDAVSFPIIERAWSKDGWLAGACKRLPHQAVAIWDDRGKLGTTIRDVHRGALWSLAWSPAGERLATIGTDCLRFWDRNGAPGPISFGHLHEGITVAWSPDGRWIASGALDSTIRLWKPDGAAGPVLEGQHSGTLYLAWSPDSQRIVSLGYMPDCTVRVWNVETGKIEWQSLFFAPDQRVTFTADGQLVHGDRDLLESKFLYIIEQRDGSMSIQAFDQYRKHMVRALAQKLAAQFEKAMTAQDFRRAETIAAEARSLLPDVDNKLQSELVDLGYKLARGLKFQSQYERAERAIQSAIEAQRRIVAGSVGNLEINNKLALQLGMLAETLSAAGRDAQSLKASSERIEIAQKLVEQASGADNYRRTLFQALTARALRQPNQDAAFADVARAMELNIKPDNFAWDVVYWLDDLVSRDEFQGSESEASSIDARFPIVKATFLEMLRRVPDLPVQYIVADWLSSAPERFRDPELALQLARRGLELEESSEKYQVLGWALFRVGKWQSAIETIGKHKTDGKSDFKQSAFVLAMAYWQLGDKEKGREWFALGNEWMSGYLKKCYEDRWRSSQIWSPTPRSERRLQSEAAELLGIPLTDDETLNGQNDTDNKP